jgi:hypothetical protein
LESWQTIVVGTRRGCDFFGFSLELIRCSQYNSKH